MKRLMIGATAVMLLSGFAIAQTASTTPNPPPPAGLQMDGQDGADYGPDEGGGQKWKRHGRHGGGMGMMRTKGFHIMAGKGHGLRVMCGQEPIKECIAAAQPLIDTFAKAEISAPKTP